MKHVMTPATPATEVYNSDFNGTYFGESGPHNTVKIESNYGSKYDGSSIELHFTDQELEMLLEFLKSNFCQETKAGLYRDVICGMDHNKEIVDFLIKSN